MIDIPVLILGAGPTGLVLALWLTRLGVRVRIIDKSAEPGTTSRAVAVQARTLEFYRQVDLSGAVVDGGVKGCGRQFVGARRQGCTHTPRAHGKGVERLSLCTDIPAGRP
jgi:2-polyprenyl-6-methoxyphenol hydroxylase-like FAD-dependent oxidoreductase